MTRADRINLLRHMRSIAGITTRDKKRQRRDWRKHAVRMARAGWTEKGVVWRKRARNG